MEKKGRVNVLAISLGISLPFVIVALSWVVLLCVKRRRLPKTKISPFASDIASHNAAGQTTSMEDTASICCADSRKVGVARRLPLRLQKQANLGGAEARETAVAGRRSSNALPYQMAVTSTDHTVVHEMPTEELMRVLRDRLRIVEPQSAGSEDLPEYPGAQPAF